MKFCPNCGTQVNDGVQFCPNCGSTVGGNTTTNTETPAQNTYTAPTSNQGAPKLVENRNIAVAVVLSIVTCGIYGIIWFISLVNDINTVCQDEKSSQSGGVVFLLSLVTCGIYSIIFFYQAGKRLEAAGKKYNLPISDNSVIYLVLALLGLGIVNYCLVQSDLNKFSGQ